MDDTVLSAVKSGNIEVLKVFLDEGKDYKIEDDNGWGPIHHAVYNGHLECMKLILEKAKSDFKSVTEVVKNILTQIVIQETPLTSNHYTPLSLAAMKGHFDIVELLADFYIESGVDYKTMCFPLHVACKYGQNKCLEILVKKMPQFINVKGIDEEGYPIHITAELGNMEGTRILIQNGCDVNCKCDYDTGPISTSDCTPLLLAAMNKNPDIVRYLIDNGADASINAWHLVHPYPEPILPIDYAAKMGHLETVKVMFENAPQAYSKYSVLIAAMGGHINCLTYLFDKGFPTFNSDTNLTDENPWLKVIRTCDRFALPEVVKILLDKETMFQDYAKLGKWTDFLSDVFGDVHHEVLTQFLDAGILELRFDCKSFPDVEAIIKEHNKSQDDEVDSDDDSDSERDVPGILLWLKYFPFLTLSHENPSVLPTPDNFGDRDLVQNVPSLLNLTKWTIRCSIIKNKGMIHRKYVESLKLPKKITKFLVKC